MILYDTIEQTIRKHENCIIVKEVTSYEVQSTIRQVMRDNPDIFWFAYQYQFDEETGELQIQYTFSKERVFSIKRSIYDVIQNDFCLDYVKMLKVQEQVSYVYKWLVSYCNYNVNSAYNQSIYSVFVRRNAVCTGYAKAAQYLFFLLGIESRLVYGRLHNDSNNGRHCWNVINIDGQFYHFDVCFGDNALDIVAQKSGVQHLIKRNGINLNFLCVSTNEILKSRSIEDIATLPFCGHSWPIGLRETTCQIVVKKRESVQGCLVSDIGSSADVYLCAKDKHTVLKVFRPDSKIVCSEEYNYMQQMKGCRYMLQCNEHYTDLSHNIIAIEQSTPLVDLLCSSYYNLSLKGVIRIAIDVAMAWNECRERGVLYRDIHICNIYCADEGIFKLGDYGNCTTDFDRIEFVGSQWFMAPETYLHGIFNEASAVYSLSMVMYFILNGLQPALWESGKEDDVLHKRIYSVKLPLPIGCKNLPMDVNMKIASFFNKVSSAIPKCRLINRMSQLISELEIMEDSFGDADYNILRYVSSQNLRFSDDVNTQIVNNYIDSTLNIIAEEKDKLHPIDSFNCDIILTKQESNFDTHKNEVIIESGYIESHSVKSLVNCSRSMNNVNCNKNKPVDYVERFALTTRPRPRSLPLTFLPHKKSFLKNLINKMKSYEVYSSIFAPAEICKKSFFQIQVYLHLLADTEKIINLATESDARAIRRDYVPLQCKLKKGDKVDVLFSIYSEERIMSDKKSVVWQGSFTKCSFDYLVSKDIDADELSCVAVLSVNGVPVGEMRFITEIVESPRKLNPKIIAHKYNKVFISYAHKDEAKVKFLHEGLELSAVPHFFDRKYLKAGDVFPQVIQEYINSADLFILCWSENASKSEYVQKERLQALKRAFPQVKPEQEAKLRIYSMSIEPRADLPSDMKGNYHFVEI